MSSNKSASNDDLEYPVVGDPFYNRAVCIVFPQHVAEETGIYGVTVPMRNLLLYFADMFPHSSSVMLEIRDRWFGGESEDDYVLQEELLVDSLSVSMEEAARRWKVDYDRRGDKARLREYMEEKRGAEALLEHFMWKPFRTERLRLEHDEYGLELRRRQLQADWRRYMLSTDRSAGQIEGSDDRATLQQREIDLNREAKELDERREELRARVTRLAA